MTFLIFIPLPPCRIAGCEYPGKGQPTCQVSVHYKEQIVVDNNRSSFHVKIFFHQSEVCLLICFNYHFIY